MSAISPPYQLQSCTHPLLATVRFDPHANQPFTVPLEVLSGACQEPWYSPHPVHSGEDLGFSYRENGQVLLASAVLSERTLSAEGVAVAVEGVYRRLQQLLQARAYPHCLRVWNFLAHINAGDDDAERYRQFSAGRYRALQGTAWEGHWPAATAIGSHQGGLHLYALAAKHAGLPLENPRQQPAFEYPREYGPHSPSFSRALWFGWEDGSGGELLVSGTASVVGHASQHPHDPARQLAETFKNLEALLEHAAAQLGCTVQAFQPQGFKLYVRERPHAAFALQQCRAYWGEAVPITVLLGDICRRDLALEIDGSYRVSGRV